MQKGQFHNRGPAEMKARGCDVNVLGREERRLGLFRSGERMERPEIAEKEGMISLRRKRGVKPKKT